MNAKDGASGGSERWKGFVSYQNSCRQNFFIPVETIQGFSDEGAQESVSVDGEKLYLKTFRAASNRKSCVGCD
jgi:hypothetical protein